MFENQTFEEIMERMLERVSDEIDKRENSVIWNALAPAAAELALSYIWL
ncbi:phage portal protein, partial [Staphylococcus aureus]|nr:phage portal protein [Staphylococcus aureus]